MQSKTLLVFVLLCLQAMIGNQILASTIFAGSFVNLSVDFPSKDVSVNYPRLGPNSICGVELKSNVLVLNKAVWERLSQLIDVQAFSDGRDMGRVMPVIESAYSPTLRYNFSDYGADYGTLRFAAKSGSNIRTVVNEILGSGKSEAHLIAVAYTCP